MDHAGGIGQLVQALSVDWILAHPRAHRHLVAPAKLWAGSRDILGDLAEFYGPIEPVDESLLRCDEAIPLGREALRVIETPGHAPHHISVIFRDYLFSGESIGVVFPWKDTVYLRPATPHRFLPDVFLASIQRLLLEQLPSLVCFGHFGWRTDAEVWVQRAWEQTQHWMALVKTMQGSSVEAIFHRLLVEDPYVAPFTQLPYDIQQREKYFISNSIKGMMGYFRPS